MTITDIRGRNVRNGWYRFGHMKLWDISEVTRFYCSIVERFTGLRSDLDYVVIWRVVCSAGCNIWSFDLRRRNLSNRNAINGGTDAAGVDSVFPMNAIVVTNQIAIPNKGSATQPTFEVLSGWMGSNVDRELGLAGERHRTAIAAQWFLRNVGPAMSCDIAFNGKSFIAYITSIGSFTRMYTFVNI